MSEDEAKKKWCPFARAVTGRRVGSGALVDTLAPHNRVGVPGETSPQFTVAHQCIASACMAWRWSMSPAQAETEWEPTVADGYCGLARALS